MATMTFAEAKHAQSVKLASAMDAAITSLRSARYTAQVMVQMVALEEREIEKALPPGAESDDLDRCFNEKETLRAYIKGCDDALAGVEEMGSAIYKGMRPAHKVA